MDYAGLKKKNNNITLTMSKEKAQIGVKIAKKKKQKENSACNFALWKSSSPVFFFILLAWMQTEEVR